MRKLLLITGDLATGKSRFAGILSKRYAVPVLYKDKIKEVLCDRLGFSTREENKRLSLAAVDIMIDSFHRAAEISGDIILEANFKEDELKRIHKIALEYGYRTLTLVLQADMDVIYQRFVNRIENEARHPAHISGFDGYESLEKYIIEGRRVKIFSEGIRVDANDFSYQDNADLLTILDTFMGKVDEKD